MSLSKSINENMGERDVDWSALPVDLLHLINPARVDAVRFRSVCASWRFALSQPCEILPPSPLPLPYPIGSVRRAYVSPRTLYRFKLPDDVNPNPSTCSSKSWLVKVEEIGFGLKYLLDPLPNLHYPFPKEISLLDYQVVEVSKEYELQSTIGSPIVGVKKLVLFPDSAWSNCVEDTVLFAVYQEGKLGYLKYGDENWTLLGTFLYDDIIVYKRKPYVVLKSGIAASIDSSMELINPWNLYSEGDENHFVESCGELYAVSRSVKCGDCPKTIAFEVLKLDPVDAYWDNWVEVKNLGDQVFIMGKDSSFSVSATAFSGCKRNCIYFTYEDDNGVFDLKTGKIVDFQDWSHLFRPPSSWLNSKSSSKSWV